MPNKLVTSAMAVFLIGSALPAAALIIIRDGCNQTSGDGQGHSCPGSDDLLLRPKYEDGTCGDWMCCPRNPDGQTYDCSKAVNPTTRGGSAGLKGTVRPDRDLTVDPATGVVTVKPPVYPDSNAPIQQHRGERGSPTIDAGQGK
jgi:hypothetical protein